MFFVISCCFFKQKTAYEMSIGDWSSDVCSSDLVIPRTDIKLDVEMAGERPAFVNYFCFRRQWRPTSVTATEAPGDPGRAPFITGSPDPAVIGQPDPASIMVSGPPEILV